MEGQPGGKPYFENLDALRFIAAMAVICAHSWAHIETSQHTPGWVFIFKRYAELGVLGVNFFFVLSGFLITYLLLHEIAQTGRFSFKRFFMRRVLRIWPLYYLLLGISFAGIPWFKLYMLHQVYTENTSLGWYVLFINNFHDLFKGQPVSPTLGALWTIAVEEQFYVFFPFILIFTGRFKILWPILIMLISIVFRAWHVSDGKVLYYHTLSIMGDFGVGAVYAFFAFNKPTIFNKIVALPKTVIAMFYAVLLTLLMGYYKIFDHGLSLIFERLILAAFFGAVIIEQVYCNHSVIKLGKLPFINYGGKISYGMYCYQYFAILSIYYLLLHIHVYPSLLSDIFILPVLSITFAYLLASISYTYFESYFLKLKSTFYPV